MAKKELTNNEHNAEVFTKIKALEAQIAELKSTLKKAELPKQADLNECNRLARLAKTAPVKVNPKLVSQESGIKK